jgi:2-C-methyl-D-erythritol 2,4-cyclodiphosphate synthase
MLAQSGLAISNIDSTIVAQKPKMAPFIPDMVANIAGDLQIDSGSVSVKAKTTEKLGFAGRGEGIAAKAVALLKPL